MHNPETLTGKLLEEDLKGIQEYFKAYQIQGGLTESVEHIKNDTIINSYHYTYEKLVLTKIVWRKFQEEISDKCEITIEENSRLTRCYYKSGMLYTEEWYNTKTSEYQFAHYDETGKPEYSEHGSSAPPKDN